EQWFLLYLYMDANLENHCLSLHDALPIYIARTGIYAGDDVFCITDKKCVPGSRSFGDGTIRWLLNSCSRASRICRYIQSDRKLVLFTDITICRCPGFTVGRPELCT